MLTLLRRPPANPWGCTTPPHEFLPFPLLKPTAVFKDKSTEIKKSTWQRLHLVNSPSSRKANYRFQSLKRCWPWLHKVNYHFYSIEEVKGNGVELVILSSTHMFACNFVVYSESGIIKYLCLSTITKYG